MSPGSNAGTALYMQKGHKSIKGRGVPPPPCHRPMPTVSILNFLVSTLGLCPSPAEQAPESILLLPHPWLSTQHLRGVGAQSLHRVSAHTLLASVRG